jgi:hypothetical protein
MLLTEIAKICKSLPVKEGRNGPGYEGIPTTAKFRRSAMPAFEHIKYTDAGTYPHFFFCWKDKNGKVVEIVIWTTTISDLLATDWEFID